MEKVFHILKLISIYTATVILLLHTFVPHSHDHKTSDDLRISCEKNDRCIIEFFGAILEHDFGEDHLERFQVNDNDLRDLSFDIMIHVPVEVEVSDNYPTMRDFEFIEELVLEPDLHNYQDRGPPSYS